MARSGWKQISSAHADARLQMLLCSASLCAGVIALPGGIDDHEIPVGADTSALGDT